MKDRIVYPIITTIVIAGVGFILSCFGFDFPAMFSDYLKEIIFLIVSVFIIAIIFTYDFLKSKIDASKKDLRITQEKLNQLTTSYSEFKAYNALRNYKKDSEDHV